MELGYGSAVQCLSSKFEIIGSIPSTMGNGGHFCMKANSCWIDVHIRHAEMKAKKCLFTVHLTRGQICLLSDVHIKVCLLLSSETNRKSFYYSCGWKFKVLWPQTIRVSVILPSALWWEFDWTKDSFFLDWRLTTVLFKPTGIYYRIITFETILV